jgi:hypothetical protein
MQRKIDREHLAPMNASYQGASSLVPNHASPPPAFAPFASRRSWPGSPCSHLLRPDNIDNKLAQCVRLCSNIVKYRQFRGNSSTGSTSDSPRFEPKNAIFESVFQSNLNEINSLQCIVLGILCSFINLQEPWCKILHKLTSLSSLGAPSHPTKVNPSHFGTPSRTHYPLRGSPFYPAPCGVECIRLSRASDT